MTGTDLTIRRWTLAIGCTLLGCATAPSPAPPSSPPALVSPDEQPSNVQHPDTRPTKRKVFVPSDVQMPGSEPPVPAMTETASPGAAPTTGVDK
ncbi:MAG TPA: hypothetical protein VI456_03135 [Polyangia bacterium]